MEQGRQVLVERTLCARLSRIVDGEHAAQAVFEAIGELEPTVDACSFRTLDRSSGTLSLVFAKGLSDLFVADSAQGATQRRFLDLLHSGAPHHSNFAELGAAKALPESEGLAAISIIPVLDDQGAPLAVFTFASHQVERFAPQTRATLEAMTAQLGGVLERIEHTRMVHEELSRSQQMLRAVLDAIPARVFWKDAELRYLGCNKLFATDAGETPQSIIGKTDLELPWIDQAELYRRDDREVLEKNQPQLDIAEPQLGADGVLRRVQTAKLPLHDDDGAVIGVLGTYADVTELWRSKQERAHLAQVIEQAVESVVITDPDGVINYVNPAFEKNTGYAPDEVLGKRPNILRSGKHDDVFYRQLWETISTGGTWTGQLINRRKDGSLYEIEGSIAPMYDANGELSGYTSVRRDVTEQAALERQLARARQMEVIGTLAGGIAHDFNNLLSGMLGFAEHARQRATEHEVLESIDEVVEAARRAKQLVSQIMTYSRESASERQPLALRGVLEGAVKLLRSSIPSTIEIEVEIDDECPDVLADATQMHQLVVNLGTNGYQAIRDLPESHRSAPRLKLALGAAELDGPRAQSLSVGLRAGRYVCLEVSDSGSGIEPQLLERIFEPYFTTRRQQQGTGLGLAIVTGIVSAHGGAIDVQSSLGRGTVFRVYLPAHRDRTPSSEQPAVARAPSPRGEGRKLLFVDDEPQLQRLGRRLLTHLGYDVTLAGDGDEALELFQRGDFDVVVTDLTMPRMAGDELASRIRDQQVDVPIVLCTGFAEQLSEPEGGAAAPFDRVLLKPFGPTELADAIAQALAQPRG
jgi:PAS domain S-box-containing protein